MFFARDTILLLEQGANVWQIPVLAGYTFSQSTDTSEVSLAEMSNVGGTSRRSRKVFTNSYSPAEWSFETYIRPFLGANASWGDSNQHCVEEALWANFIADNSWNQQWSQGITQNAHSLQFSFSESNTVTLGTFNLYFVIDQKVYKIHDCVANEASVEFNLDDIAKISWSGFGRLITEEETAPSATITESIDSHDNFIRSRLTSLSLSSYNLVLTGGSIVFSNNIQFLTPETIGIVNQPIGHITGHRSITGNFTCYLDNSSSDFFSDIIEEAVPNSFSLSLTLGQVSPQVVFSFPRCYFEVPTHSIEDAISIDSSFHALSTQIDGADEASITYSVTAQADLRLNFVQDVYTLQVSGE